MQILSIPVTTPAPPSRVYVLASQFIFTLWGSSLKILVDILLMFHVLHIWCGSFNAAIFAVGNSLIRKPSSHILHIFTVTLPLEQQCFSSCSRWVLASAWCCWPFLPLVVPLAHQIMLSALDKTTLILLLLPRPVQSLDMLTSSPSFALFIPADRRQKGRPAGMWG